MKKSNAPDYDEFESTKLSFKLVNFLDGPRDIMRKMYNWVVSWSDKPSAERALGGLSFAESSFFPIPPDPLLIAMVVSQPKKWMRFATITTVSSVLGGVFGYLIGLMAITAVMPVIINVGYEGAYNSAVQWFESYGALAVIVAGVTPIPYKVFTIAGGAAAMSFPLFVIGSIIGRGARFYLVAFLMYHFGRHFKDKIEKYIDILGLIFVALIILGFVAVEYLM